MSDQNTHNTRTAKQGDTVRVHYKGTLDDGNEFDNSVGREPLEFRLGTGQVIKGFERTVDGMQLGETRTARLNAADAYGTHRAELVVELSKEQFPEDASPETGQQLELQQEGGERIPVVITAVEDETVTLDANHPLAGEALTFEIELVEIVDGSVAQS